MDRTHHNVEKEISTMINVGIDIAKLKHVFSIYDTSTGQVIKEGITFTNDLDGFTKLLDHIKGYDKDKLLFGMEDTGHYHLALFKFLLDKDYKVALINPLTTNFERKANGDYSKNDHIDSLTICDILSSSERKKKYRISDYTSFESYEMKQLTRHHHDLKEELNVYKNRLQKSIDIIFPEFNSLFKNKYGTVYMDILSNFPSAYEIANTDIRTLDKLFKLKGKGNRISLNAKRLKEAAKKSIGIYSSSEIIKVKNLVDQIKLIEKQIIEIDKKIEEHSVSVDSPILSIPGISHFSGTSILAEIGNIDNFNSAAKIIKFAGVSPSGYESGMFSAKHSAITKKGSKYLRKTLYQIILPVIRFNPAFNRYFNLKLSQGKSFRCAQGHCVRKLLRVIFHLLKTNQRFDPLLLD